jgi:hypothetical protein
LRTFEYTLVLPAALLAPPLREWPQRADSRPHPLAKRGK